MGGLAGHMSHLYDNPRLTFTEIKSILQDAAAGNLEGTEKTDGQNLYISFSVPKQELEFVDDGPKAARNKGNIKSGGMSTKQLADKFSFNPGLKKSFSQALRDFGNVVKSFPRDKQVEIFGPDTNIYYNAEIINPETANVINYDSKLVSIHRGGGAEFDKETGAPVQVEITDPETGEIITGPKDVSRYAQMLSDVLDGIQQDLSDNKFKIEMDAVFKLKALENKEALQAALSQIEEAISHEGISDSQMVIEYVMARILSEFTRMYKKLQGKELQGDEEEEEEEEEGKDDPGRSHEETEKLLLKRILFESPSYRDAYGQGNMPREVRPDEIVKGASKKDKNFAKYFIQHSKKTLQEAIEPIESAIHDFTVEMLRGLESLFVLDNKKETDRLKDEVSKAIEAIEASGHKGALEILQKQMNKLKSVENVSTAAEGFVFDHDGWSYKFTGNFAPINQILGLFKYGRSGIPAMEKLEENEIRPSTKRTIAVYPGRFQPMGKHHLQVFKTLQAQHGDDNVYILTSDTKTSGKSPLNFEEKKNIMIKHGIPADQIIKVRNPYRIIELDPHFDADNTTAVYVVGAKDHDRLSAGNAFDKYEEAKGDLVPFSEKAYLQIAPHVCITLKNGEEMCGTSIRSAMKNLDEESFEDLMGWFDKDIYDMLKKKTSGAPTSLSEMIFDIIKEVKSEEQRLWACAQIDDPDELTVDQAKEFCSADLEEYRTINYGTGPTPDPPKKKKKKKTYSEPGLQDDYRTDKENEDTGEEFDPLEELSAMSAGAVTGPGADDDDEETLIREYIRGIKIKTKRRPKAN